MLDHVRHKFHGCSECSPCGTDAGFTSVLRIIKNPFDHLVSRFRYNNRANPSLRDSPTSFQLDASSAGPVPRDLCLMLQWYHRERKVTELCQANTLEYDELYQSSSKSEQKIIQLLGSSNGGRMCLGGEVRLRPRNTTESSLLPVHIDFYNADLVEAVATGIFTYLRLSNNFKSKKLLQCGLTGWDHEKRRSRNSHRSWRHGSKLY